MTYLDWAATAIPRNEILEKSLIICNSSYGNPSSQHQKGSESNALLQEQRVKCASILGTNPSSIFFTSGGSESNSITLLSFLKKHITGEIITTSIEHPSVSEPIDILKKFGWKVKNVNPGTDGIIQPKNIVKNITENTKIVSLIYVHNETGVIQPVKEIVKSIREKELEIGKPIHIHIDGVQAVGKINIDLDELNIDSLSISGHKFGAPRGIGVLYLKKTRDVLIRGGGQENGIRPGTENLFGILSLTECLSETIIDLNETTEKLETIMSRLISGVRELGVFTIPKTRQLKDLNFIPNILSLSFPPLPGEVIARVLDSKGFMVSTGSACSSNKKSTTKGILSMGITEKEGFSSFRVSIGRLTTLNDIENFLKALKETLNELAP